MTFLLVCRLEARFIKVLNTKLALFERSLPQTVLILSRIIVCECVGAISVDDAEEAQDAAAHLLIWRVLSRYVV